jgi:DNA-binding transcriptional LysR family regulator
MTEWFARHAIEPRIVAEIDSLPLVIGAVEAGLGNSFVASGIAALSVATGKARMTELPVGTVPLQWWLCHPATDSREILAVADLVAHVVAQSM